jgi:hypothetical protein
MFKDVADGWVLDVSPYEHEMCALIDLFCSRWLMAPWILFSNLPVKIQLDKVEGCC